MAKRKILIQIQNSKIFQPSKEEKLLLDYWKWGSHPSSFFGEKKDPSLDDCYIIFHSFFLVPKFCSPRTPIWIINMYMKLFYNCECTQQSFYLITCHCIGIDIGVIHKLRLQQYTLLVFSSKFPVPKNLLNQISKNRALRNSKHLIIHRL